MRNWRRFANDVSEWEGGHWSSRRGENWVMRRFGTLDVTPSGVPTARHRVGVDVVF